jgi:hypothetical protein
MERKLTGKDARPTDLRPFAVELASLPATKAKRYAHPIQRKLVDRASLPGVKQPRDLAQQRGPKGTKTGGQGARPIDSRPSRVELAALPVIRKVAVLS